MAECSAPSFLTAAIHHKPESVKGLRVSGTSVTLTGGRANDSSYFLVLLYGILIRLAAETEDTMANFFTYEERLTLQKLLKEGLYFK
jgi:hypothetical protein